MSKLPRDTVAEELYYVLKHKHLGYMLIWQEHEGYLGIEKWHAIYESVTLANNDEHIGHINDFLEIGFELVPNFTTLPVHPCAICDEPVAHSDYLCRTCRSEQ